LPGRRNPSPTDRVEAQKKQTIVGRWENRKKGGKKLWYREKTKKGPTKVKKREGIVEKCGGEGGSTELLEGNCRKTPLGVEDGRIKTPSR